MALKSSQPRRSASPKSERPILRTTKAVETPNNCSWGLANTVAMDPASLLVVAAERSASRRARPSHARKSRSSPANQGQRNGALPDDICRDRSAELYADKGRQRSRLGEVFVWDTRGALVCLA